MMSNASPSLGTKTQEMLLQLTNGYLGVSLEES